MLVALMLPCLHTLSAVPPVDTPPLQVVQAPDALPAPPAMGSAVAIRRRYTLVAPPTYWPLVHVVPPASTTPTMVVPDREVLVRAWRLKNRRTPRPIQVQQVELAENGHAPAFSTSTANASTEGGSAQPHVLLSAAPQDQDGGGTGDNVATLDHISTADRFASPWSSPADDAIALERAEAPCRNLSSPPTAGGDSLLANASILARVASGWTRSVNAQAALDRTALPPYNYSSPTPPSGLDVLGPKLMTLSAILW